MVSNDIKVTMDIVRNVDLSPDEVELLIRLLYDAVDYGGSVPKIRMYLNILDKLQKLV